MILAGLGRNLKPISTIMVAFSGFFGFVGWEFGIRVSSEIGALGHCTAIAVEWWRVMVFGR